MITYDTETCGLHGIIVLIQYKIDDGPIELYCPWVKPVKETLELIEMFMEHDNVGFNLAFDHFHLSKMYTVWSLLDREETRPDFIVDEIARLESEGRNGLCIKPKRACDIMLHCRKGKYQNTMPRKDIRIKRIHQSVAWEVRDHLENNIKLNDIYFANRKNNWAPRWGVFDTDEKEWKDIVLKFKPSGALKTLAMFALGYDPSEILKYGDVRPPEFPVEVGYAPFATAVSQGPNWNVRIPKAKGFRTGKAWPALIEKHIAHWHGVRARKYAVDDVKYTYELWKHLGSPEPGDDDSELACMVGANRWRGYEVNHDKLDLLKDVLQKEIEGVPLSPSGVKRYLLEVMKPDELEMFELLAGSSTKKIILEELAETWDNKVGKRAGECLKARQAKYKLDMVNKLKIAGRFHASADIIGALSGRKSGKGGDFNSQGIVRDTLVRQCFTLASDGMQLCGGDFEAFEVVLAIAIYGDKKLEAAVRSGKKIHALFGMHVYPDMTYDEIMADKEIYARCKSAVFAMLYGGEAYTLMNRLGVSEEAAEEAYQSFLKEYPGVASGRAIIHEMFCSMKQPGGIGTRVIWSEPKEYAETIFGFKRFFTLENQICKALYKLANSTPDKWKRYQNRRVMRREREQSVLGAIQTALYAAAFALQSANMRAAGNHVIQGSGAQITKNLERNIWDVQPPGIHPWAVQPMNEHDEVMCPCRPDKIRYVKNVVQKTLDKFKAKVPLISIDWHDNMESWAEK